MGVNFKSASLDENGISRASQISTVFQTVFPEKNFKNPLEFPKSLSHCESFLLVGQQTCNPLFLKYKQDHTLSGCFFLLGTHMNTLLWLSFFPSVSLLFCLNASIPPFLLWLHIQCEWVTKSVHVCVCMRVSACVRVNGLCSLLLPPCWVFPSPWLLLPLSHSKLQGVGSSPLSGSFTFSALPLPSSYLSPVCFPSF